MSAANYSNAGALPKFAVKDATPLTPAKSKNSSGGGSSGGGSWRSKKMMAIVVLAMFLGASSGFVVRPHLKSRLMAAARPLRLAAVLPSLSNTEEVAKLWSVTLVDASRRAKAMLDAQVMRLVQMLRRLVVAIADAVQRLLPGQKRPPAVPSGWADDRREERRRSLEVAYARRKKEDMDIARKAAWERGRVQEEAEKTVREQAAAAQATPVNAAMRNQQKAVAQLRRMKEVVAARSNVAAVVAYSSLSPVVAPAAPAVTAAKAYAQRQKEAAENARKLAWAKGRMLEEAEAARRAAAARKVVECGPQAVAPPPAPAPAPPPAPAPSPLTSTTAATTAAAPARRTAPALMTVPPVETRMETADDMASSVRAPAGLARPPLARVTDDCEHEREAARAFAMRSRERVQDAAQRMRARAQQGAAAGQAAAVGGVPVAAGFLVSEVRSIETAVEQQGSDGAALVVLLDEPALGGQEGLACLDVSGPPLTETLPGGPKALPGRDEPALGTASDPALLLPTSDDSCPPAAGARAWAGAAVVAASTAGAEVGAVAVDERAAAAAYARRIKAAKAAAMQRARARALSSAALASASPSACTPASAFGLEECADGAGAGAGASSAALRNEMVQADSVPINAHATRTSCDEEDHLAGAAKPLAREAQKEEERREVEEVEVESGRSTAPYDSSPGPWGTAAGTDPAAGREREAARAFAQRVKAGQEAARVRALSPGRVETSASPLSPPSLPSPSPSLSSTRAAAATASTPPAQSHPPPPQSPPQSPQTPPPPSPSPADDQGKLGGFLVIFGTLFAHFYLHI